MMNKYFDRRDLVLMPLACFFAQIVNDAISNVRIFNSLFEKVDEYVPELAAHWRSRGKVCSSMGKFVDKVGVR
jgi:hypothetical protein